MATLPSCADGGEDDACRDDDPARHIDADDDPACAILRDANGDALSDRDAVVLRMGRDEVSRNALVAFLATPVDESRPFVLRTAHTLSLHFDHHAAQSLMSLKQPERLVLAYTRTMMGFLLFHPSPRTMTMIGLGGGSVAKYSYRHLPQTRISAIEVNPAVVALRDTFRIPGDDARFNVVCADGAEYIGRDGVASDVILVDTFGADRMPDPCSSIAFFNACRERLTNAGVLVVNFGNADPALPEQLARLEVAFGPSHAVVSVATGDNFVAFAWKDPRALPSIQALFERAKALAWAGELDLDSTARGMALGERFDVRRLVWCESDVPFWRVG